MSGGTRNRLIFDAELKAAQAFWIARLPRVTGDSGIPPDFKRSKVYSPKHETVRVELSDGIRGRLEDLSGGSPLLTYTTLLAALGVTLRRYTAADTIIVGSPAAQVADEIASSPNALAIGAELSDELPFRELLRELRNTLIAGYEHQRYPIDAVIEDLGIAPPHNRCPLFDVVASLEGLHGGLPAVKQDMTLVFSGTGEALTLEVTFNARLHRRETVSAFLRSYVRLLESALESPASPISALAILTPEDERAILEQSTGPSAAVPDLSVTARVEAQVDQTPLAVAVECRGRHLSYRELDERANQLARLLRSEGAGTAAVPAVGISMFPGPELIVGLVAILKSGAAYVPLDPTHPSQRLALMVDDAELRIIVSHARARGRFGAARAKVICVDEDEAAIAACSNERVVGPGLDDLAYVIFTSGSTGRPKGVCMPHGALSNLLSWQRRQSRLAEGARTLHRTSISFDVSFQEIFATLCSGGTLVVAPQEVRDDIWSLPQLLVDQRIERAFLPFVALQQLAKAMTAQDRFPSGLREVITAGEQLRITPAITQVFRQLDECSLVNQYGPTETHVVTSFALDGPAIRWPVLPPIGRAIDNARIYVLDARMRPVPAGAIGELYVGGVALARGYLGRPELTAERFPPNPFDEDPDARLYRTGDLARRRLDGDIEFLGRIDRQVKIRGHRVELGEVETALMRHSEVGEAVAMGVTDEAGLTRLVAWVTSAHGLHPSSVELRRFLDDTLTPAMIPAVFVRLAALPLTPTGKIDHRALPAPDWADPEFERTLTHPRTPTEQLLARIWSEVLGVEQVGISDSFLTLGGDSILATEVVARATEAGLAVSLRDVFQHQTLGELALVALGEAPAAGDLEQGPDLDGPAPLTAIQRWFFEQRLPNPNHWNMGVLLESRTVLDLGVIEQATHALVTHHGALHLRFRDDGSGHSQVSGTTVSRSLSVIRVDLSSLPSDQQPQAITERAAALQTQLDIAEGPLVLVAVFDLGPSQPGRLLFTAHHLVMDGVSLRIAVADLETAYSQIARDQHVELPAATSSFVRWARLARDFARSTQARDEIEFWSSLGERPPALPRDFPDGRNTEACARTVEVALGVDETRALLEVVPAVHGARIEAALLAALALALHRWTGASSALVDVEGHGREEVVAGVSLARTVGWFTSLFPVRLDLGDAREPTDALLAVRGQLERIPNRGIGYGLLRYLADSEVGSHLASLPRPELSFNYLGQFDQQLSRSSLFSLADESTGPLCDPQGERTHLLYVGARIVLGRLRIELRHSEEIHRTATIDALAASLLGALREIIAASGPAPRDTVEVSQAELELIAAAVAGPRGEHE